MLKLLETLNDIVEITTLLSPSQTQYRMKGAVWKRRQLQLHISVSTRFFWNYLTALTPLSVAVTLAEGICNMSMDSNSMTMPMSDPNAWATAMNNLGMPPIGITGQQLMPGNTRLSSQSTITGTVVLEIVWHTKNLVLHYSVVLSLTAYQVQTAADWKHSTGLVL